MKCLVLIGGFSYLSVHYAEKLVKADIIRGVRWLRVYGHLRDHRRSGQQWPLEICFMLLGLSGFGIG